MHAVHYMKLTLLQYVKCYEGLSVQTNPLSIHFNRILALDTLPGLMLDLGLLKIICKGVFSSF